MVPRQSWPRARVLAVVAVFASILPSCGEGGLADEPLTEPAAGSGSGLPTGGSIAGSGANAGTGTSAGGGGTGASAGAGLGGSGGATPDCSDVQHPEHMGEPCSIWPTWDAQKGATEPKDCDADWLTGSGYCLASCGQCALGTAGSSGGGASAGGASGGGASGSGGTGGSSAGSSGSGPVSGLPDLDDGAVYWASRYWDCCKPHCAWFGMPSCGSDGVSSNDGDSACAGGPAYACYNQAPRAVSADLSYGHVAVPNPSCGSCYHLQFTGTGEHNQGDVGSQAIAGKHMIVKVTNTGGDVAGNQFDLMIPGGGVGINPNTCSAQWGVSSGDLGPAAGGFLTNCAGDHSQKKECVRQKCALVPAGDARDGCLWFVDWLEVADNPNFRYEPIDCPPGL